MIEFLVIASIQLVILGGAEMTRKLGVGSFATRKGAHVAAGVAASLLPFIVSKESAVLAGLIGAVLMGISVWRGVLPSIGEARRIDIGALGFPLGLSVAAFFFWTNDSAIGYQYAALILALPDALAGIIGTRGGRTDIELRRKTPLGSLMFALSAFVISVPILYLHLKLGLGISLMYATVAALLLAAVEWISGKGFDNLTLPASAGATLYVITQLAF